MLSYINIGSTSLPYWQEALDFLTLRIEDKRIITVFNSVVGNNTHRKIPAEESRSFVLVDDYAPFLFVNSADTKAAQMFPSFMSWLICGLEKVPDLTLDKCSPQKTPLNNYTTR